MKFLITEGFYCRETLHIIYRLIVRRRGTKDDGVEHNDDLKAKSLSKSERTGSRA